MLNFLSRFEFLFWVGGAGMQEHGQGSLEAPFLLPPNFLAPEGPNVDFSCDGVKSVLPRLVLRHPIRHSPRHPREGSQRIPFPHTVRSGVKSCSTPLWILLQWYGRLGWHQNLGVLFLWVWSWGMDYKQAFVEWLVMFVKPVLSWIQPFGHEAGKKAQVQEWQSGKQHVCGPCLAIAVKKNKNPTGCVMLH